MLSAISPSLLWLKLFLSENDRTLSVWIKLFDSFTSTWRWRGWFDSVCIWTRRRSGSGGFTDSGITQYLVSLLFKTIYSFYFSCTNVRRTFNSLFNISFWVINLSNISFSMSRNSSRSPTMANPGMSITGNWARRTGEWLTDLFKGLCEFGCLPF